MNDELASFMERTVTVTAPDGETAMTIKLWQAAAAAAAGVILAPRATAAGALVGLFSGVQISFDELTAESG